MTAAPLRLPSVSLVTVTSVAIAQTAQALERCLKGVEFGAVCWCSDHAPPPAIAGSATWHRIAPIHSRAAYSRFVLHQLAGLIRTDHALLVQWDGFVVAPDAWDDAFLNYDYIGAPWPHFDDDRTVGNGGFSLRSRRLLEASARLPLADEAEDVAICRTWRTELESVDGLVFAPAAVASRFSFERGQAGHTTFGFHGAFNLTRYLPRREAREILRGIDAGLLARNEMREIFWKSITCGDFLLAREMLARGRARTKSIASL